MFRSWSHLQDISHYLYGNIPKIKIKVLLVPSISGKWSSTCIKAFPSTNFTIWSRKQDLSGRKTSNGRLNKKCKVLSEEWGKMPRAMWLTVNTNTAWFWYWTESHKASRSPSQFTSELLLTSGHDFSENIQVSPWVPGRRQSSSCWIRELFVQGEGVLGTGISVPKVLSQSASSSGSFGDIAFLGAWSALWHQCPHLSPFLALSDPQSITALLMWPAEQTGLWDATASPQVTHR